MDSLIGNIDSTFKIKIQELDYYLRNYDPNNNFETFQKYYSDDHFIKDFTNKILHDDFVALDTSEITIYEEDDPDTDEVDESTQVKERLSPRIIIPLDIPFFQSKIIDKEGSIDLSVEQFQTTWGLLFSAYDFSDDLLMILDYDNARIKIAYEYDVYNDNNTTDDTSDDIIEKAEKDFEILLGGNQINLIKKGNFVQPF